MVNCNEFIKKLDDFIEGNVPEKVRLEMEEHILGCRDCSNLYTREKAVGMAMENAFLGSDIKFKSSRESILNSVNKNRYGKNAAKKMYFVFRKNISAYLICAVLIVACVFSYPYIREFIDTDRTTPGQDTQQQVNNSGGIQKMSISIDEAYLPLPENTSNSQALSLLNKIKDRDMGSDRWTIVYSKDGKVIFYNAPGLLAYSNQGGKGEYYGAVDMEKIGCNYMSGETISLLEPSPNGNFVVIWNWDVEALVNGNTNIYIYDFAGNREKIIERKDKADIIGSWSSSSRYYAFGDRNGKYMNVYDGEKNSILEIPLNIGTLKQVFTCDNGDVIAISDKSYLVKNNGGSYNTQELPISGEILGFTKSLGIAYFQNGIVSEYKSGENTVLKEMGSTFKLAAPYKITGDRNMEHPVFSDGVSTIVYDMDKAFYTYSFGYNFDRYMIFSEDSKKCFATYDFKDADVITYDGKTAHIASDSSISGTLDCKFLDNNTLVRIMQKGNSTKLGDFALVIDNIKQ